MNKPIIAGAFILFMASGSAWAANSPGFQNNMHGSPDSYGGMRDEIRDAARANYETRRDNIIEKQQIRNDNAWKNMNERERREEMIREYRGVHGQSPNGEELRRWEKNRDSFWNNARVDEHRDELSRQYKSIHGTEPTREELTRWHNERVREMRGVTTRK